MQTCDSNSALPSDAAEPATPPVRQSHSVSAVALAMGRLAASALGLATAMILSRQLSPLQYGSYQQVWLVYNTLLPFVLFGLPASITYFIPQVDARSQKMIVVQSASLLLAGGAIISIATYLLTESMSGGIRGESLRDLLKAFFLFPMFTLPLTLVDALLVATGRARAAGWFNVISAGVQFAAVIVPVALGYPLTTVMYALSVTAVLRFAGIGLYFARQYAGIPLLWDRAFIGRQLRYSIPLGLSSVLGSLTLQLDRIMIASRFGPRDFAVYVNGATELPFVPIIAGSVMSVVTPEFVRLYRDGRSGEILRLWHSATRKVAVLLIPLTALLMAFGGDFVITLFSKRYTDSTGLFRIFLLLLPLRITVYGSLLMAAGLAGLVLRAAAATLALNVVLNLVLIPLIGMPGASIATVTATYAMAAWQLARCADLLDVSLGRIFPWAALFRISAVSTATAALSWVCTLPISAGVLRLGVGTVIFVAAAVPLLWYGGARSDMEALLLHRRAR